MSRHVREARSVSLFPFLAVLICAMGALIFLLVVTTRRIRHQAIMQVQSVVEEETIEENYFPPVLFSAETAEPEVVKPIVPKPVVPEIVPEPEPQVINLALEHEERLKSLSLEKAKKLERLKAQNLDLIRLKNELTQSENSLEKNILQTQLLRQKDAELIQKINLVKQQKSRVTELLQEELRSLQEKKQTLKTARSKYSVVPYDGQTGTSKRPILIECSDSGLTFIPEGVTLTPDDLNDFTPGYNPLLAGAQALIQYWSAKDQRPNQEPYVLILVRPSGSVGYYVARKLLNNLTLDSGYELIDADWDLELPQKDPKAEQACQAAIDRIMSERKNLVSQLHANQSRSRPGGRQLKFDARTGMVRVIEPEETLGRGRGAHRQSEESAKDKQQGSSTGSRFSDMLTPRQQRTREKHLSQLANQRHIVGDSGVGKGGSEQSGKSSGNTFGTLRSRSGGTKNVPGSQPGSEIYDISELTEQSGRETGEISGLKKAKVLEREQLKQQAERHLVALNDSQVSGKLNQRHKRGRTESSSTSSVDRLTENSFKQTDKQLNSTRASSSTQDVESSSSQSRSPRLLSPGQSASGAGNTKSSFSLNQSQRSGGLQTENTSSTHHRWQPQRSRSGIGFEREISVQVGAEKIIVGEGKVVNVDQGISQEELLQSMIVMMDQHLKSWGPAPKGFYWVPSIKFTVSPGGNQYYERLKLSAQKMGLQTEARFSLDPLPVTTPSIEEPK